MLIIMERHLVRLVTLAVTVSMRQKISLWVKVVLGIPEE